jgi:pilus assembly protein CpaF
MNKDPLHVLLNNPSVSEILINDFDKIYFECDGRLQKHNDYFSSSHSYLMYIEGLCEKLHRPLNREQPFLEMNFERHRYSLIYGELSSGAPLLSIRKQVMNSLSLETLVQSGWCGPDEAAYLQTSVQQKKNLLIAGPTSSGKTTVLQSLLNLTGSSERCLLIEDTRELLLPNTASASLLAREFKSGPIAQVSLEDLIRRALRLRPDRLIVGEVRGAEAYSLLLALSTGHRGSLSSVHAANAKQALLRLEMLVQLGAPEWDLRSIRRLITLSTDAIVVVEKTSEGRKLKEICEVKSLEESGIILEKVF